jgi:hypothetical protein
MLYYKRSLVSEFYKKMGPDQGSNPDSQIRQPVLGTSADQLLNLRIDVV